MKAIVRMAFVAVMLAASAISGAAQEGCKTAQSSCSQLNADCERKCQNGNDPSACVARFCSVALTACKANGVWKVARSPGCWKTNNRS